jgi:hypothetical protein
VRERGEIIVWTTLKGARLGINVYKNIGTKNIYIYVGKLVSSGRISQIYMPHRFQISQEKHGRHVVVDDGRKMSGDCN